MTNKDIMLRLLDSALYDEFRVVENFTRQKIKISKLPESQAENLLNQLEMLKDNFIQGQCTVEEVKRELSAFVQRIVQGFNSDLLQGQTNNTESHSVKSNKEPDSSQNNWQSTVKIYDGVNQIGSQITSLLPSIEQKIEERKEEMKKMIVVKSESIPVERNLIELTSFLLPTEEEQKQGKMERKIADGFYLVVGSLPGKLPRVSDVDILFVLFILRKVAKRRRVQTSLYEIGRLLYGSSNSLGGEVYRRILESLERLAYSVFSTNYWYAINETTKQPERVSRFVKVFSFLEFRYKHSPFGYEEDELEEKIEKEQDSTKIFIESAIREIVHTGKPKDFRASFEFTKEIEDALESVISVRFVSKDFITKFSRTRSQYAQSLALYFLLRTQDRAEKTITLDNVLERLGLLRLKETMSVSKLRDYVKRRIFPAVQKASDMCDYDATFIPANMSFLLKPRKEIRSHGEATEVEWALIETEE